MNAIDHARFRAWLRGHANIEDCAIEPVSGDASFRRYFRVDTGGRTCILMDAPPDREDSAPFVDVTRRLTAAGLNVPRVLEADLKAGILLLDDLGDDLYLNHLHDDNAATLYRYALDALQRIQAADTTGLPDYDRTLLLREMALFREWFLERHLGLGPDPARDALLNRTFEALVEVAHEQPQVFVHRDYHARNLMLTPDHPPGILDYQDAVHGPVTYDLVSLLKDSYIAWPRQRQLDWVFSYRDRIVEAGIIQPVDDATFLRWFDLTGVQRQLKVCGIFARLNYRDGKPGYLRDIPLTWRNLVDAAGRYPETRELARSLAGLDIEPGSLVDPVP
ncbi:MAG: phosphotransferase [Pseudomonadota bacterium]|nr:phosphotransferase [Pseudomonadota bacterium]